jgi:hypothetical protein
MSAGAGRPMGSTSAAHTLCLSRAAAVVPAPPAIAGHNRPPRRAQSQCGRHHPRARNHHIGRPPQQGVLIRLEDIRIASGRLRGRT